MPDIFCDNIRIKWVQTLLLPLTLLQLLLWLLLCLNQYLIVTALWLIFCYYNLPEQMQSTHLTKPCLFSKHSNSVPSFLGGLTSCILHDVTPITSHILPLQSSSEPYHFYIVSFLPFELSNILIPYALLFSSDSMSFFQKIFRIIHTLILLVPSSSKIFPMYSV